MTEITLEDFILVFVALFRNKLLILFVTAAGFFAGEFYTTLQSTVYVWEAVSSVVVTYSINSGQTNSVSLMINYADVAVSNRVCEYASVLLANDYIGTPPTAQQIQGMVSTGMTSNSVVMKIRARNSNGYNAIYVANAVAESFVSQVSTISGNQSIQVLDVASTAASVSTTDNSRIRIYSAAAAFIAICGMIALWELFSNKVRSINQCVEDEREILTIIPYVK